jgi:hypothetical protein
MGHAGKSFSFKTLKAVLDHLKYLEDGRHPNHRNYKKPQPLRVRGLEDPYQFPAKCEELMQRWHERNPLHNGKKPTVLARWWMPRFADRTVLSQAEMELVEDRLLSTLPKGVILVYTWHLPEIVIGGRRQKGPDFNFMFGNITRGPIPKVARDSATSHWGILTQAMDNVVNEINRLRHEQNKTSDKKLPKIATMAQAKARRRKRPSFPLCEQLACLDDAGDSLDTLNQALTKFGYHYTPAGNGGYVARRHCPVLEKPQPRRRFKGRGYFITLDKLLVEVRQAIQKRKESQGKKATQTRSSSIARAAQTVQPTAKTATGSASAAATPPRKFYQLASGVLAPVSAKPAPAPTSAVKQATPSKTPVPVSPIRQPATTKAAVAPTVNKASAPPTSVIAAKAMTPAPKPEKVAAPAPELIVKPPTAPVAKKVTPETKPIPAATISTKMPAVVVAQPKPRTPAGKAKAPAQPVPAVSSATPTPPKVPVKAAQVIEPKPPVPSAQLKSPVKPSTTPPAANLGSVKPTPAIATPAPLLTAAAPVKAAPVSTDLPPQSGIRRCDLGLSEPSPEQQIDLATKLVQRVLATITDRDVMLQNPQDYLALTQRAGGVLLPRANTSPADSTDSVSDANVTLRIDGEQCEINESLFQLNLCMAIINARLPKQARRVERDQLRFIATDQDGIQARYRWLCLIQDSWADLQTALADENVKAAWITAFQHTKTAGEAMDWSEELYQALTSADVAPDVARLMVASQVPATISDLNALEARINERAR